MNVDFYGADFVCVHCRDLHAVSLDSKTWTASLL